MCDPCTRCLARDMSGDRSGSMGRAFLGAKFGTGIHSVLQDAIGNDPNVISEKKIVIGSIDGYGEVKSTPDAVRIEEEELIDWKGSDRVKSKAMQQFLGYKVSSPIKDADKLLSGEMKVRRYIGQGQLYAKGLNAMGITIKKISIVVINRDGTGWFDYPGNDDYENDNKQRDVWSFSVPYNEAYADKLWSRAQGIWDGLEEGMQPDEYPRHRACYRCDMVEADRAIAAFDARTEAFDA